MITPAKALPHDSEPWKVSVDRNSIYSNDDIIDAYLKGKEEGMKQSKLLIIDKLSENVNKLSRLTERMLDFLGENNFNAISAHLKMNSYNDFVILVTLPEDEYISEEISKPYQFASQIEDDLSDDKYLNIMFTFSDRDEKTFNKNLLISDGFFMDYKMDTIEA